MGVSVKCSVEHVLYNSAIEYVLQAGQLIRSHLGNKGKIEQKKNAFDLVTEVDRRSEDLLRRKIHKDYPSHWILSEENCGQANVYEMFKNHDSDYGWIIDPIDGTTNFIHGIPYFAISIGVVKDGEPVIGVVFNPVTDELYTARKTFGAYLNGRPIRVGKESTLAEAVIATGFQASDFRSGSRVVQQIDQLAGRSRNIRLFGSASLDLCLLASGRITGFWHDGLNPWDTAAGILILTEAGGKATDKDGNPYRLSHDSLIASNGRIHGELIETIKL
ncbi:inositol monophosphatase family protein [Geobacillus sp. PK12]|uniref:inositol monophosphatase family protein n=1 Tax=Geobacillus sp. PK12 TaxID=2508525 RepID=UPI0010134344|nr:inositol monophosphatase family protein [Geobacillus sp. PK12]RXS91427.1 inositol monophosphatase [Geobacillus sp. PK12]